MYKLLKNEIKELKNYWNFIKCFDIEYEINKNYKNLTNDVQCYRKILIHKIREKYTAEDFYKYETILNKLLWNLIEHLKFNIDKKLYKKSIKKYFVNEHIGIFSHKYFISNKYTGSPSYKYLVVNEYTGSFSHKMFLVDEKKGIKYYFKYYRNINTYDIINKIFYILSDKTLYKKIIKNKISINDIRKVPIYYYPLDYPFPNINLLFYNENNENNWIDRINKLYFNETNNIDKGWYSFGKI
jgi:hypothetical protein